MNKRQAFDLMLSIQSFLAGVIAALSGYKIVGVLFATFGLARVVSFIGLPIVEILIGAGGGLLAAYTFGRAKSD